jgi:hypothetical protein
MPTTYVLVRIDHAESLEPEDIIARIGAGEDVYLTRILDVDIPNGRDNEPYIAF